MIWPFRRKKVLTIVDPDYAVNMMEQLEIQRTLGFPEGDSAKWLHMHKLLLDFDTRIRALEGK